VCVPGLQSKFNVCLGQKYLWGLIKSQWSQKLSGQTSTNSCEYHLSFQPVWLTCQISRLESRPLWTTGGDSWEPEARGKMFSLPGRGNCSVFFFLLISWAHSLQEANVASHTIVSTKNKVHMDCLFGGREPFSSNGNKGWNKWFLKNKSLGVQLQHLFVNMNNKDWIKQLWNMAV